MSSYYNDYEGYDQSYYDQSYSYPSRSRGRGRGRGRGGYYDYEGGYGQGYETSEGPEYHKRKSRSRSPIQRSTAPPIE